MKITEVSSAGPKWTFSITTSLWSFDLQSQGKAYKFTVCGQQHETTRFVLRTENLIPFTIWINKSIPQPKKNVNSILLWFSMLQFKLLCQIKQEWGELETTKRTTLTFDSRQMVNSDPDVTRSLDTSVSAKCKIRLGLLALTNKMAPLKLMKQIQYILILIYLPF